MFSIPLKGFLLHILILDSNESLLILSWEILKIPFIPQSTPDSAKNSFKLKMLKNKTKSSQEKLNLKQMILL